MPSGRSSPRASRPDDAALTYPAREDTELLVPFARRARGRTVLEIGTGAGRIAVEAARQGAARVVATDLNPHALRVARALARARRVRIDLVRADLARGLGRFEVVLANPPYLPTRPHERDRSRWVNLALDGGADGCRSLARILARLPAHLAPAGVAYVLVSSRQDPRRRAQLRSRWNAGGGAVRVVASRRLEGERLDVWELRRPSGRRPRPTGSARRSRRRARGTPGRRRSRPARRRGSSPAPGRGRTSVPGAASGRRRSRPGW